MEKRIVSEVFALRNKEEMNSSLKEVLDKHRAFWNMEDLTRPLLATFPSSEDAPMKLTLADGTLATQGMILEPQMLSAEKIHPRPVPSIDEARYGERGRLPRLTGDIFSPVTAYSKVPWMEAIIGCPIHISVDANTMWARSIGPFGASEIHIDLPWVEKLKEFTKYLVDNFFDRFLVSPTLMRGPIDMLTALLGKNQLVLSMHRRRRELHSMANALADLFITTAKAQLEIIPSFHGGYCNLYGLWGPGTLIRSQDDESAILSPKICEEFVLPYHEKIASEFDFSLMDIHSGAELHMIDLLLDTEHIKSVSVTVDPPPYGAEIDKLLPILSRIQKRKPLLVSGKFTRKELEKTLRTLSPRGLAVRATKEAQPSAS